MELYISLNVVINALLLLASICLGLPIAVLFAECMAGILFKKTPSQKYIKNVCQVAILIPAHNEAISIGTTLSRLAQSGNTARVIVIADNCTDETAVISREYGATVLQRRDLSHRGKGYALDYGLQFLKSSNPPDVVAIVDADCIVNPGTIEQLAQTAIALNRPVQATNLLRPPLNFTHKDTIATLAFMVKNLVRQRGLQRLGLPVTLTGTGMALPWSLVEKVTFATGNLVEDKQLGIDLTIAGYAPVFCEEALVSGYFPQEKQAKNTQKVRWVHGHLQILTQVPQMIRLSLVKRRFDLLAIALDLAIPPLSLLCAIWFVMTALALFSSLFFTTAWISMIFLGEGLLIFLAILGTWLKFGRSYIKLQSLLTIPIYVIENMSINFAFVRSPQKEWIRTARDKKVVK
jgi:cellulose synthase/poly-beta-1,6-N-acetylglucosamine synthase-like glycosyltransferase